jgi:hypothetical protein
LVAQPAEDDEAQDGVNDVGPDEVPEVVANSTKILIYS